MTRMRTKAPATKAIRYALSGAIVGLLVVLSFVFISGADRGPSAEEAERIRAAQERVHAITPDNVPAQPTGR